MAGLSLLCIALLVACQATPQATHQWVRSALSGRAHPVSATRSTAPPRAASVSVARRPRPSIQDHPSARPTSRSLPRLHELIASASSHGVPWGVAAFSSVTIAMIILGYLRARFFGAGPMMEPSCLPDAEAKGPLQWLGCAKPSSNWTAQSDSSTRLEAHKLRYATPHPLVQTEGPMETLLQPMAPATEGEQAHRHLQPLICNCVVFCCVLLCFVLCCVVLCVILCCAVFCVVVCVVFCVVFYVVHIAVLCCAVLCCAVLCCAVLRCVALRCIVLRCVVLCCVVLCCVVLCCVVLCCVVLCCVVLCCVVLCCVVLCCVVLCCVVLCCVVLCCVVVCCAVLCCVVLCCVLFSLHF